MSRRVSLHAFFTASLLCGLAIIATIYATDPTAAPPPLIPFDAGRKLLQVPTAAIAPVTPAPAAPSPTPAAQLPTASPSLPSPSPTALTTPAAGPAAPDTAAATPAEPPSAAADTTPVPELPAAAPTADQAAGHVTPTDPAAAAPNAADISTTAEAPDAADPSAAAAPNGTDPSIAAAATDGAVPSTPAAAPNGTAADDDLDPADPAPDHWQFPWHKFWLVTGFVCAGAGACGLVAGLVLGTLQGFGMCQNCSCDPESAPKSTTTSGYSGSSSYSSGSSSDCCHGPGAGEAVCCLFIFGLALLAVAVYLLMPIGAASLGYGSGYVVGAALATVIVLTCPCTDACRARRAEWKGAWAERAAAARARAGLPSAAAAPAVELPSAKVTSDATDAGCKAGNHDMHSVDLEAVVVPPRQAAAFELC